MLSPLSVRQPAKIVALQEDIQPTQYLLETDVCMIGRAEICQIRIPQETISRIQAVIEYDEHRGFVLHDSNSANGTYVNGQHIYEPYLLAHGDEIGLSTATALLRFEITSTDQGTPRTT
jgi:pSer/pThr/pTyr-binding forkhead associated (FHA) protein